MRAALAGLPAAYIIQQVATADSATSAEIAEAARYFSRLHPRQRSRVVETTEVPRTRPALGLYVLAPEGGVEPLGRRLIEVPADQSRHELRDAGVGYITYVPPGSIARGRVLATTGTGDKATACTGCHGPQPRGVGLVPPLAGRSPSYMLRQLLAFKVGARSTPTGAPMRGVAAALGLDDMIAAAAYAGSRRP